MYSECHAHIKLNHVKPENVSEYFESGLAEAHVRRCFEAYRSRDILFVRDGGDRFGVSALAKKIAPEYGIDYRSPVYAIHKKGFYGGIVGKSFDTVSDFRNLLSGLLDAGGDFVKIMMSGILDFDRFGVVSSCPTKFNPEFREIIHISHEEGLSVMVHANTPGQILAALEYGADSIEHGFYMDEACREAFLETGAVFVPTLGAAAMFRKPDTGNDSAINVITENHMASVRRALELGIPVASGSDSGISTINHGQGLLDEIAALEEACLGSPELLSKLHASLKQSAGMIRDRFRRK